MGKPVNPIQIPDLRQEFNKYDLSVPASNSMLYKFPFDLGDNNKENEPAILFKFHDPIAGQGAPTYPLLNGPGRYIGLPIPPDLQLGEEYKYDDSGSTRTNFESIKAAGGRAWDALSWAGSGFNRRMDGKTLNPAAAIVFNSPEFRSYSLSWTLYAKTKKEAARIREIIQLFRIAAAAEFVTNEMGQDLKYPSLVSYVIVIGQHFPFPASYPCFIESVKFSPIASEDQVVFFEDGQVVGWKLDLALKESMWLDRREIGPISTNSSQGL